MISEYSVLKKLLSVDLLRCFYGKYINSPLFKVDALTVDELFECLYRSFLLYIGKTCYDRLNLKKDIRPHMFTILYEVYSEAPSEDDMCAIYSICRMLTAPKNPPKEVLSLVFSAMNEDIATIIHKKHRNNIEKILILNGERAKLFLSLTISATRKPFCASAKYNEPLFDILSLISNDAYSSCHEEALDIAVAKLYSIFAREVSRNKITHK